ncbi:MAG: hypothetical protein GXO79_00205 [Chlorobi bacterium]|nr:hypothetical protein [Chlorobiota bacterium]
MSYIVKYSNTPYYGLNLNYHLLPYLIKADDFRFDLYLTGKFGGHYIFSSENYAPENGNIFDYKIGCGISFYLWKHIGFFTEIGLANFSNLNYNAFTYFSKKTLINSNYGLTFKF